MSYNGRATPRAEPGKDVYVFWSSDGPGVLSRVRNLNLGGIFIETHIQKDLGTSSFTSLRLKGRFAQGHSCATQNPDRV